MRPLALALGALVLAGCQLAPPGSSTGGPIRVVAAESMWGSLASQLGGSKVDVLSLIENPNVDPHSYEPTAADARATAMAQVLVVNGLGYDAWASRLAAADPAAGRTTIDIGHLVGLRVGDNPHRWYSPVDVLRAMNALTNAYAVVDPADRGYFEQRAADVRQSMAGYFAKIASIKARFAGTAVGASESIFAPLAAALGLDLVTPATFLRAVSEGTDPTVADLRTIDAQISGRMIKVYVENVQNLTPDVSRQVAAARAAGIPVVAVTETLVPVNATFQQWQTAQLTSLAAALGGSR